MSLKDFSPSEDEMNLANHILLLSDCQQGVLKSDAAIVIFNKSGLSYPILRDIWSIADENSSGELTIHELSAAIRLMGWVQAGEVLKESLLIESGPLPTLEGLADVVGKRNVSPLTRFPPVDHDDIRRFKRNFDSAGPIDGFLNRDNVLEIYMESSLSYAELWKIRKLVDVTERGALSFREFAMGMYLIQSLQSCLIASVPSTVPPELHDLFSSPPLVDLDPTSKRPLHSHQSSSPPPPPLPQSSTTQTQILPIPVHILPVDDSWDVLPIERFEANRHFQKLDFNRNGYIEGKEAANFMLSYNLSPEDLAHIWSLADLSGENRLTKDGFAVAMHLINRKVAGDEIPTSLPPSLVPPSMRSKGTHSSSPPSPLSPKHLAKFKSPPPPPPKRVPSRVKRSSFLPVNSTTPDHIPHFNVPVSLPPNLIKSPKVQSSFPTPPLSPSNYPDADLTSPFEDPVNGTSPFRHQSLLASKPVPSNHSSNEALEEFKKETSRLTLQVNSLLSQLTAQNNLQDVNESLRKERDSLKAEMQEMERTVSEVLSANDQNGSEEQYIQEINRLSTEFASKEAEYETTQRMLAVLTEEDTNLRRQLRESEAATAKAKSEIEDLQQNLASREGDVTELRARLSDMGKEMAEGPESMSSNNRELRVLLRDVTRENDSLKGQVRDMQKSMEQLLLSTKSHAKFDEVERENRRLQGHVQELEMLATRLQSTPNNSTQRHHNQVLEEAARENEQLKAQLQTGHRAFAEFRTSNEITIEELQRKLATMEHENNQLKMEVASSSERGQADNNIPPPAYNDSFSIS